jgi:hypothetical protein
MQHLAQRILSALQIKANPADNHKYTVDLLSKVLGEQPSKDGTREAHWQFDGLQVSYYSYQLREISSYGMTISRLGVSFPIKGKGYYKVMASSFPELLSKAIRSRSEYVTSALASAFSRAAKIYMSQNPPNPEA